MCAGIKTDTHKMKYLEIDPQIYGKLIFYKNPQAFENGIDNLFN